MRGKLSHQETEKLQVKFYKSAFEKTTEDRRKKIFDVALGEFAVNGYNATNINVIAKKSGVSIGAMYSYFASKEDLFLSIVDKGFDILESALKEVNIEDGDIFDFYRRLLNTTRNYVINYPEFNQIYLDITTQGLSSLSNRLSNKLEAITAELYRNIIKKARQSGVISRDIDERMVSFCLDNLLVMFQFSFTSDYYRERMKIFLGDEAVKKSEDIIDGIMAFVRKALV